MGKQSGANPALVNQAATHLGPSGFDPDEEMAWVNRQARIENELNWQDRDNAGRPDFKPAIDREQALRTASAVYGIYDCRNSDFAACYAWDNFWRTLGLDPIKVGMLRDHLKLVVGQSDAARIEEARCSAQAIEAQRAETPSGSVHESAVAEPCAPNLSPPSDKEQ